MPIVTQGWGAPFDPLTGGYGTGTSAGAGCAAARPLARVAWPAPFFQPLRVEVWRPPPPGGGKIGAPAPTGRTAQVLVQPQARFDPISIDPDGRMYYNHAAYTLPAPCVPDIREQDRLVDPCDIDPHTRAPAQYIVRAVWRYPGSHLELFVQRQAGA